MTETGSVGLVRDTEQAATLLQLLRLRLVGLLSDPDTAAGVSISEPLILSSLQPAMTPPPGTRPSKPPEQQDSPHET